MNGHRPRTLSQITSWIAGGVLTVAIVLQLSYSFREEAISGDGLQLADRIRSPSKEWVERDLPLGETEIVQRTTLKTLNLDEYIHREFRRGTVSFTIYAAHWVRGRMPARLVASHAPDRCWTENGMKCVEMRFREPMQADGRELLPAEYRVFTAPGIQARTYVVYWHTVEGRPYDYGNRFNATPHPWRWWKDTAEQAIHGSREQLFVRLTSNVPFDLLWREPGFADILQTVAEIGLWGPIAERI